MSTQTKPYGCFVKQQNFAQPVSSCSISQSWINDVSAEAWDNIMAFNASGWVAVEALLQIGIAEDLRVRHPDGRVAGVYVECDEFCQYHVCMAE
ncbi:MAG: hypothetical protein WAX89_05495 [Alphaproteobacteria bacterium]